jgi:hypothetical protein
MREKKLSAWLVQASALAYSIECLIRLVKKRVPKLGALGTTESEANLRNKISRGGLSAAFFIQALVAIGAHSVRLHEAD